MSAQPSTSFNGGSSPRRVKVLVLHHLGGNSHAMRKRVAPLVSAMPNADAMDFVFCDAPYVMPGLSKVEIVSNPGGTVDFGGPAVAPNAPADVVAKVQKTEAALRALSLARAVETEIWSEQRRPEEIKRASGDLEDVRTRSRELLSQVSEDKDALRTAAAILNKPCSNSKQSRWWVVRSNLTNGRWIGEEYALSYISRVMREQGPFDGVIGFSSGAMMAQMVQALLNGSVPRSAEPAFQPPSTQGAFKWSLLFSPFVPFDPYYVNFLRQSGTRPSRLLVIGGAQDRIVDTRMARQFAELSGAETLAVHEGSHVIPDDPHWCLRVAAWFEAAAVDQLGDGAFDAQQGRRLARL